MSCAGPTAAVSGPHLRFLEGGFIGKNDGLTKQTDNGKHFMNFMRLRVFFMCVLLLVNYGQKIGCNFYDELPRWGCVGVRFRAEVNGWLLDLSTEVPLLIYQHLPRGHQWKPLHYIWIPIGHPLEGPGMLVCICHKW